MMLPATTRCDAVLVKNRGGAPGLRGAAGTIAAMEFVEPEDEQDPFRSPLPPDDRLWRHPSEWASIAPPLPTPRRVWPVALASAFTASVVSATIVVVLGGVLRRPETRPAAIERQMVTPVPAVTSQAENVAMSSAGSVEMVAEIAERVRPAIAQVRVGRNRDRAGSAVIFRSDGHLLTNAYVVQDAEEVTVVLANGREYPGRVLGTDADTDAAVVKIEGGPFPVATLGTAAGLRVGQRAVAIGSPLGMAGGPSVTVGVVSALHRDVRTRDDNRPLFDMVQTDAPIAPGSSGGALLDSGGSVVGITTAMAMGEDTRGFAFATPIDVARAVSDQLIAHGRTVGGWLGVQGSDVDGVTAGELAVEGGAMVAEVVTGSPAERSGMAVGDVIVALDGQPISSMGELVVALRSHQPGDSVTVSFVRDGDRRTARTVLAARPGTESP